MVRFTSPSDQPEAEARAGAGENKLLLKIPWVDRSKCKRESECKAAAVCKQKAFEVQPPSEEEPGLARDCPLVDLERCKQCGECEKTCPEHAVKMV